MSPCPASRFPARQASLLTLPTAAAAIAATVGAYAVFNYSTSTRPSSTSKSYGDAKPTFSRGFNLTSLRLHSIETVSHDTKRLRFELPEENARSGLSLTSSLLAISRPQGRFFPVIRPYTPIGNLSEPGFIEFLIKQYPHGASSSYLHSLSAGDSVTFAGPIRGYSWTANKHSHIALIAGGTGITPMAQLARGILENPDDKTQITLVHGVNSERDLVLRNEFEDLQARFPGRFSVHYTVSKPGQGLPERWHKGYVDKEFLEQVLPGTEEKIFVCGPPAMEEAMLGKGKGKIGGVLGEMGYVRETIYKF